ncbi:MAG: lipid A deacylase LpxR family protein [Rhodospirillaceae bacterium]
MKCLVTGLAAGSIATTLLTAQLTALAGLARAADPHPSTIGVQIENDLFGDGRDQHYTNGIQFTFTAGDAFIPDWHKSSLGNLPYIDPKVHSIQYVAAIGQKMYTPEDTSLKIPGPTDRPYAGWLFASLGAAVGDAKSDFLQNGSLDIGIAGPLSGAGYTQRRYHTLINVGVPRGWGEQLDSEPGLLLTYQARLRKKLLGRKDMIEVDFLPSAGAALGNILIQATVGVSIRIGQNLDLTCGPPFIRPSLPAAVLVTQKGAFGWNIFAGVEGRAVGHDIFLDGNTFGSGPSVDKETFAADFQGGAEVILGRARVTFTQILRTREFAGQESRSQFGSISLSYIV